MFLFYRFVMLFSFCYFAIFISNQAFCQSSKSSSSIAAVFLEGGYSGSVNRNHESYLGYNAGATVLLSLIPISSVSFVAGGGFNYEALRYHDNKYGPIETDYYDYDYASTQSAVFVMGQAGFGFFFPPNWALYTLGSVGFASEQVQTENQNVYLLSSSQSVLYSTSTSATKHDYVKKGGGLIRILYGMGQNFFVGWEVGGYAETVGSTYYTNLNVDLVTSVSI